MAIAARDTSLSVSNVNLSWLVLDDRRVPLDGQGNLLLRFRGPKRTFPYHSAADVLGGAAPADAFANRIVLVGTTALGTRDVVTTPLDTLFAGVEVHATAIDNLLQRDYLGRHEHGVAMAAQLALTLGAAATVAIAWLGFARAGFVIALALAALYGGTFWLLQRDGLFVSPLFPTASLLVSASAMAIVRYRTARANAEQADRDKATSQRLMVRTLLSLTEIRDADTGRHARRTEQYTRVLATELASDPAYAADLTPARIELMANLAPLHDIGKVGVPDRLLNKPGKLTEEERVQMQQHAQYGRDVIERAQRDAGAIDDEILTMAKEIVYTHHEKWDGSGYPRGLRGSEIPIVGRIMAVVDVYDAIMSRRAYQAASSHDVAVSRVVDGRGTHFDPDVVNAFERVAPRLAGLSGDGDR
jgi:adenylate cyclase